MTKKNKKASIGAIAKALTERFLASGDGRTCRLTMKCDGAELELRLSDVGDGKLLKDCPNGILDCEEILVQGDGFAVTMGGSPLNVCAQLRNYEEDVKAWGEAVEELRRYGRSHSGESEDCDEYTWFAYRHRDLLGVFPDGWTVSGGAKGTSAA